uniref:Uncharacterized protein n=1 Tax=Anguilla anguilla TaxID=7936 RepID=A0A0E9W3J9_ANGAN
MGASIARKLSLLLQLRYLFVLSSGEHKSQKKTLLRLLLSDALFSCCEVEVETLVCSA